MVAGKGHFTRQGIVATQSMGAGPKREIFFPVDPADLDFLSFRDLQEAYATGAGIDFDPKPILRYLPELEQEIFYLAFELKKEQKDIAKLLGVSQPTVSYRYRRTLAKLSYLVVLDAVDTRSLIDGLDFLRPQEREILFDLLYSTNQEYVGRTHGVRQSSVKWILVKTKRNLVEREVLDPERWSNHLGLIILLERNLNSRIKR